MKNLFNISLLLFAAFVLFSCRSNDDIPEDIHEHEEIEMLVVKVVEKNNTANTQSITYIGGKADKALVLENGKTYDVNLDFQVRHDDHYHSANDEIIEEKDEHFIIYEFANINATIKRSATDVVRNDGKKLGLVTEWKINSTPANSKVNIKLNHGGQSANDNTPSADNQLGNVTGGESDVNAFIDIN